MFKTKFVFPNFYITCNLYVGEVFHVNTELRPSVINPFGKIHMWAERIRSNWCASFVPFPNWPSLFLDLKKQKNKKKCVVFKFFLTHTCTRRGSSFHCLGRMGVL